MSLKNSILAPVQQTEFLGLEILRNETICSSKKGRGDCLEVVKCNGRQFDFKGFDEAEPAIQRCSYKNVLCSKFTGEHQRRSMKLHFNFIDIPRRQGVISHFNEFFACFQNTFSYEHLWTAASDKGFVSCNRYNCRP